LVSNYSNFCVLEGNKITSLNGRAFLGLRKLKVVRLDGNTCINEDFNGETKIATLQQVVTTKCAFDETSELIANLDEQFKSFENFMKSHIETLRNEKNQIEVENQEKAKKIDELQAELMQKNEQNLKATPGKCYSSLLKLFFPF
jgi:regulator of replication initiation timing